MLKKGIKGLFGLMGLQVSKKPKNITATKQDDKFVWLKNYQFQTIVDVGSNTGQFAERILHVFPNAKIHCFEPLKDVFEQLKVNFQNNHNVSVYNFGLGEKDEEREIYNNEYSPSSSMLEMLDLHKSNFDFAVKAEPTQISIRRLDSFFLAPITGPLLLKIDVQGFELYVLNGGSNVLKQADLLLIEVSFYPLYKDQPLFNEIYSYLYQQGFHYAGNIEQLIGSSSQILQADALFVNKKHLNKS